MLCTHVELRVVFFCSVESYMFRAWMRLKYSSFNSGVSYEDRVGRRKEEIESLQEALKILNGEDIA